MTQSDFLTSENIRDIAVTLFMEGTISSTIFDEILYSLRVNEGYPFPAIQIIYPYL